MQQSDLISDSYAKLLHEMHTKKKTFGNRADLKGLDEWIKTYHIRSILDYGCGKGNLVRTLKERYPEMEIMGFDPAIPEFKTLPETSPDLIVCTDVLEHVEPDKIDNVLTYIFGTCRVAYLTIACYPAKKGLPDGRNAHILVKDKQWWLDAINEWDNWSIREKTIKHVTVEALNISGDELELLLVNDGGTIRQENAETITK